MRLLDLFCGAGGSAVGYHRAGFDEIVGIDIKPQPHYPFTFIQADALHPPVRLGDFDLIHASPPCQAYSQNMRHHVTRNYPQLIESVRKMMGGRPYVIENVRGAPLPSALVLCGTAFGLTVWRHRYFETSWATLSPGCSHEGTPLNPYRATSRRRDGLERGAMRAYGDAMGVGWMRTAVEITEAIPPAYTEYLGTQFLDQLAERR